MKLKQALRWLPPLAALVGVCTCMHGEVRDLHPPVTEPRMEERIDPYTQRTGGAALFAAGIIAWIATARKENES